MVELLNAWWFEYSLCEYAFRLQCSQETVIVFLLCFSCEAKYSVTGN